MKMYFYLQLKRVMKLLPFVSVLTVILLGSLAFILQGVLASFAQSETNTRYTIAVTGDTDNEYLQMGIAAMQTFDESRFAVEFATMTEDDAKKAIARGDISAYIIIPDDFVEKAFCGEVDPITFVTSAGIEGLNGLLKKELTSLITDIVIAAQKGTYGLADVLSANGLGHDVSAHLETISIDYTELVFRRNDMYDVTELGISDGLSTTEYYVCAILIVLLVLVGLPFATVCIKQDYAFYRLILSRGCSARKQVTYEYLAFVIAMLIQAAVILIVASVAARFLPFTDSLFSTVARDLALKALPVIVMLTAFNMMMFELADTIVSGLLLHFFTSVGLCYITGCLYPINAFPQSIQTLSHFLPIGIARLFLASAFTFDENVGQLIGLAVYSILFFGITVRIRFYKISKIRG